MKLLQIQVEMLDSTRQHFQMPPRCSGHDLYSALIVERLGLLEADYFDLEYVNKDGYLCRLDHLKPLCKQHNAEKELIFTFCVKFYAPHPNLLEDEYTRYLFALQIKKDLFKGHLQCSENTAALLAAFIVQAEIGDFLEDAFLDRSYLEGLRLVPSPTPNFLDKVMECHRSLVGQTPTEADSSLLDTARKVEMFGIRLRPVKGSDGISVNLAVSHAGLFVFQGVNKVNTFSWARIRKLSFKRKKFVIKLHPEGYDAVEFFFESRNECKSFWKQCIEHHAFFRCQAVKSTGKNLMNRKGTTSRRLVSSNRVQMTTGESSYRLPDRSIVLAPLNPSQQSIHSMGTISCESNHHTLSAHSLPTTTTTSNTTTTTSALDELPLSPGTASYLQLSDVGGPLRYPQRLMLVMQPRPDGSIGQANPVATPGGFLVMLPTTGGSDQQQQMGWISATQQQQQQSLTQRHQRTNGKANGCGPKYQTLQTSLRTAPFISRNDASGNLTEASNHNAQTLGPIPVTRVLSPTAGVYAAAAAASSSNTKTSSRRVLYIDSATGRLISDNQLVVLPRPGGFNSDTPSHHPPSVLTAPVGSPFGISVDDGVVGAYSGYVDGTSTAGLAGLPQSTKNRPHGPPPPAPERRDSVHPRDRQFSTSTLDSGVTSKSASLSRPPFDPGVDDAEKNREDPPSPIPPTPPVPEPDPAHPFPFNVIPAGSDLESRRLMQISCLSLAARSARSSCQSLIPTDEEDIEVPRHEPRRHPSSRSASLHRNTFKRDRTDKAIASTQDDMATVVSRSSSASSSRCQSAVDPAMLASKSVATSNSSSSREAERSLRSSRKISSSGTSQNARTPPSAAFYLLRELTMTERTYKKDIDVIIQKFVESFADERKDSPAIEPVITKILSVLDPIRSQTQDFLHELESRFSTWSSRIETVSRNGRHVPSENDFSHGAKMDILDNSTAVPIRVGDLFVTNLKMLQVYRSYLAETECLILDLERLVRSCVSFERRMQSFEGERFCYLPFYAFLLKPMHRLLQYRTVLERLMRFYSEANTDMQDCRIAHARILDTIQSQWDNYKRCENLYKTLEVERDLVGLRFSTDTQSSSDASGNNNEKKFSETATWLARPSRQFIREGLLQKLSKKGYQQRMFFLFSDQLIYAGRTNASHLQFKIHGQFPLRDLMVEESDTALSFTIYSGYRCFLVAAPSAWQRDRWLEDISRAILAAKTTITYSTRHPVQSSANDRLMRPTGDVTGGAGTLSEDEDAKLDKCVVDDGGGAATTNAGKGLHRATTSVHVCWHRSSTFSMSDVLRTNEYQTSGYLLRKFKNSNGWQKLWVVFTHLCMFFHKSYQDTFPLASLPLLGYTITTPGPEDNIRKDFVFKLQFKNHVYFFRDDSQTSFERWFDCLRSAAGTGGRQREVGANAAMDGAKTVSAKLKSAVDEKSESSAK